MTTTICAMLGMGGMSSILVWHPSETPSLTPHVLCHCAGKSLLSKGGSSSGSSGSLGRAASFPPHKAKGIPAARPPSQPLPESKLQT